MDASRFISSGLVEAYVSKLATPAETQELERGMVVYPEVAAAVDDCQHDMEQYVSLYAVKPPAYLRQQILNTVETEEEARHSNAYIEEAIAEEIYARPVRVHSIWRWIAAASIILLAGSLFLGYTFYNRYNDYKIRYGNLLAQNSTLTANTDLYRTRMEEMSKSLHIMKDPAMKMIKMPGTQLFPDAMATVYWNANSKEVFVLVNNLPAPAPDKQYQLWAIVDGKPVDMGMLEPGNATPELLQKMKSINAAEMFAITLEKKGGSATPTSDQMYVAGKAG